MKLRRKEKSNLDIDTRSFADVAFLLIVFFILATTFQQPFGHEMEIPAGESGESEDEQLTVNLKKNEIYFGEESEKITLEELRKRLEEKNFPEKSEEERMVIVESGREVQWDHYFDVVMTITEAGGVLALVEEKGS